MPKVVPIVLAENSLPESLCYLKLDHLMERVIDSTFIAMS